jgi:hypothetical protein
MDNPPQASQPTPPSKDLFYGPYKIVREIPEQSDQEVVCFELLDPGTSRMKKKRIARTLYEHTVKDQPTDHNTLVLNRVEPMVLEILETLLKYGAEVEEIQHVFKRVGMSVDHSADIIDLLIWGTPREERTMIEIDRYMKKNADKLPNDNS